ncbi:N-acetylmuramoyl-L-alanine amidase [Streptomyces sp. ME01-24h]|nr:N-acetylmuramoyl-L-alanine amidase [Streptomyces sp. ME19-03-3]MDX3357319.1 N-acetylmuramoyl-L-alanine amidase [Streptomyces sp. ME01-24h]
MATVATYGTIALASPSGGSSTTTHNSSSTLQDAFASAAEEFKVPQSVLMAVSYRQTLWDAHNGQPSTTGNYNVMGLTQVNPGDVAASSGSTATAELNQSGDPAKARHFHPDAHVLRSAGTVDTSDPRLHTLDEAAKLTGASANTLKTDSEQSVRGAAALLAQYEKDAYGSLPPDAGRWYAAVARFSQSPDARGADLFAQRVFTSIRTGESRVTDDGQQVTLPASPSVRPVKLAKTPLAAQVDAATTPTPECPQGLNCNFVTAGFKQNSTDKADYGNYDVSNRPDGTNGSGDGVKITSIVIHDTEGGYAGSLATFQDSTAYASAHYLIRASDGLVTQMVPIKDTAWHAGNKSVNMHSVGIEHEGYAIKAGSWYSEPQYESSAQLVRYLAQRLGIPLDREHIFGHDEVSGVLDHYVSGMHWDPGPYWDWNHYFALMGVNLGAGGAGGPVKAGQVVRFEPPFTSANEPTVTYGGVTQAAHPTNFGYLYTSASTGSARISDPYLHSGTAGTTDGPDWGDKVVAGGRYVVAATSGANWTAIWYGGQKAWFYNPGGQYTAVLPSQQVVKPAAGATIQVYGRAYPEVAAYTGTNVPVQDTQYGKNSDPLTKYAVHSGEAYVPVGPPVNGDYFYAMNYDNSAPGDHTLVTGTTQFYPIRYNHRLVWLKTTDVSTATSTAPDPGTTRTNMLGRDASGVLWQYQGTGSATSPYFTRFKVGAGWQVYNTLVPLTELKANGTGDMVARDTSGVLWYYQGSGNPSAPFKARLKVGAGWSIYNTMSGVRDVTGDGRPDLVARDSSGVLWLYQGTGTPATPFKARVKIGAGWGAYNSLVALGDFTGDGKGDMLARDTSGGLYLYTGTGSASAPFKARVKIGTGWQIYNAMVGPGDMSGDGKPDLIGRDSAGALWFYKGTGSATAPYAARVKVGTGWQIYGLLV